MSSRVVSPLTYPLKSQSNVNQSINVAVIGAGAAGLATARAFSKHGLSVKVFEKESHVGGVWAYEKSKLKPMYKNLRTNLPKEIMAFREYPFECFDRPKSDNDNRHDIQSSFISHTQVRDYLSGYCRKFHLESMIQFGSTIEQLTICKQKKKPKVHSEWPQIQLDWTQNGLDYSEVFDAVCVCNGHYAAPSKPFLPGLEYFQGHIMHSIEYDDPSEFAGKSVLCIGGRASGSDIAREVSEYAKYVYLSDTSCQLPLKDGIPLRQGNVFWVPRTEAVMEDCTISFEECTERPHVDVLIFCTGYDYHFPFINDKSNLELNVVPGERRVSPLFDQLWHAHYPSLAFIGLQHSIVPFPFFELQAEAIVTQWLGDTRSSSDWKLPSLESRIISAEKDANQGGPDHTRVQDTHYLGSHQWDSCIHYGKRAGILDVSLENYIATNKAIYDDSNHYRKSLFPGGDDTYRNMKYKRLDDERSFEVTKV